MTNGITIISDANIQTNSEKNLKNREISLFFEKNAIFDKKWLSVGLDIGFGGCGNYKKNETVSEYLPKIRKSYFLCKENHL